MAAFLLSFHLCIFPAFLPYCDASPAFTVSVSVRHFRQYLQNVRRPKPGWQTKALPSERWDLSLAKVGDVVEYAESLDFLGVRDKAANTRGTEAKNKEWGKRLWELCWWGDFHCVHVLRKLYSVLMLTVDLGCHWSKLAVRKMSELLHCCSSFILLISHLPQLALARIQGIKAVRTHVTLSWHSHCFQDLSQFSTSSVTPESVWSPYPSLSVSVFPIVYLERKTLLASFR